MISFSFIVPIYNVEDYLAECLDSLLAQTYPHWEAVLVDDASKDASLDVAKRYANADPRFKVIANAENQGPSKTRNTGLRNVKGNYIYFVDSDDWIDADTLERTVEIIHAYPGLDIVSGDYVCFYNDETRAEYSPGCSLPSDTFLTPVDGKTYYRKILDMRMIFFSACVNAFRRDLILAQPILFDEEISIGEDLDWKTRVLMETRSLVQLHRKYYHYRSRAHSLIRSRCSYNFVHSYKLIVVKLRKAAETTTDPDALYIYTHLLRSLIVNIMKKKDATALFKPGDRTLFADAARWLKQYPLPRGTHFGLTLISSFPPWVFQTFYGIFRRLKGGEA